MNGFGESRFTAARRRLRRARYVLVVSLPWGVAPDGAIWVDRLWAQDLLRHTWYLSNLTVLAPKLTGMDKVPPGFVPLPAKPGLRFEALPQSGGLLWTLVSLPWQIRAGWRAVASADLVHSGVAGWPIPLGLILNPMAVLRRRWLVIVIESAFWRTSAPDAGFKARLRHQWTEAFARWSVRKADLAIFSHAAYCQELGRDAPGRLVVAEASWLEDADILGAEAAEAIWDTKPALPRFLFAGRLEPAKGVNVLLKALEQIDASGVELDVDVMGDGSLRDDVESTARRLRTVRLRFRQPVAYGAPFMERLQEYTALVVPSISDEQPRVLLDGFAQALPAIATDTSGHRAVVAGSRAAIMIPKNDAPALADALLTAARNPSDLRERGIMALQQVQGRTHFAMHLARAELLAEMFGQDDARSN